METWWLIGPKSAYTSVLDQDPFNVSEDELSTPKFQQTNTFENTVPPAFRATTPPDSRTMPTQQPSVVKSNINTRPSISGGQCPFGGDRIGL